MKSVIRRNRHLYNVAKNVYSFLHPSSPNYEFSVELTTVCNMQCGFCNHDELILSGIRKQKHMDKETLESILDFIEKFPTPKNKRVTMIATGLGEPFTNPKIFELLRIIRQRFPGFLSLATNGVLLNERVIKQLADLHLNILCISLRFPDRVRYKQESNGDYYDTVVQNILTYLKYQRNRNEILHVQIFETEDYVKFQRFWQKHLKPQDKVYIIPKMDMIGFLHKTTPLRSKSCSQPQCGLTIDVDGDVFPCCESLWTGENQSINLGNVSDGVEQVFSNLERIQRLFKGKKILDFAPCKHCPRA